jgi:uncharacterized protein YbaR (Trm112 family)
MTIDPEFLDLLVCPLSRADLVLDGETLVSTDPATRRRYRIDDGIPVLLIDEAEELDPEAWRAIMERHGRVSGE